jgi:dipeptidyl aminopeptidase/acylaminoacyl peptidase
MIVVSHSKKMAVIVANVRQTQIDHTTAWDALPKRVGVVAFENGFNRIRWINDVVPYQNDPNELSSSVALCWSPLDSVVAILAQPQSRDTTAPGQLTVGAVVIDVSTQTSRTVATLSGGKFGIAANPRYASVLWTAARHLAVMENSGSWLDLYTMTVLPRTQRPLVDGSSRGRTDLQFRTTLEGRLIEIDSGGVEHTLLPASNQHLVNIAMSEHRIFTYQSSSGRLLRADILLPYNYVPGIRYPTVVVVYGGRIIGSPPTDFDERQDASSLNELILAGHGYAVLNPSMPLDSVAARDSVSTDDGPMWHLNDGVDAAVDSAIALGVADSTKLFLFGHSYGGYSVYGLAEQTRRYKAAVAINGFADLLSRYATFDRRYARTEPNYAATVGPWYFERGQGRMGAPPSRVPLRYLHNSPITYAASVEMPLLIVTGSLDAGAANNEEFYTVLSRLKKRVKFVCYLGEDHIIMSPQNVTDMWRRIFDWYDTSLRTVPSG